MSVEVVRWPADSMRLAELREASVPRLLVVADDAEPPVPVDCLEDWVTTASPEREVDARRRALSIRAEQHAVRPLLDDDGLLHHRDAWVSLSPVEQSLASAMLDRFGAVVTRDMLADRAWPTGVPTRNALDVHVLRLRRRIAPLGLEIRTVRSRGYLMQSRELLGANGH
jgi:DNA-binding response OmpR family regulator